MAETAASMELREALNNAPTQIFNNLTQSVMGLTAAYTQLTSIANIWQQ